MLVGLSAVGCATQPGNQAAGKGVRSSEPVIQDEFPTELVNSAAESDAADAGGADARRADGAAGEADDSVGRVNRILRERAQAQQAADDLRELRDAEQPLAAAPTAGRKAANRPAAPVKPDADADAATDSADAASAVEPPPYDPSSDAAAIVAAMRRARQQVAARHGDEGVRSAAPLASPDARQAGPRPSDAGVAVDAKPKSRGPRASTSIDADTRVSLPAKANAGLQVPGTSLAGDVNDDVAKAPNDLVEARRDAADASLDAALAEAGEDFGDRVEPATADQWDTRASGAMATPMDLELSGSDGALAAASPTVSRLSSADPLAIAEQRFANRVAADPRDLSAQLEYQLLRFLKNDDAAHRTADLSGLPGDDQELLAAMCDALTNFRSVVRGQPNALGTEKARPFVEMAERIRSRSDLSVSSASLCERVTAFAVYTPIEPLRFPAGVARPAIFYCEVDGFLPQLNEQQQWETKLSLELKLYSASRELLVWSDKPQTVTDVSRKRRRDFFVAKRLDLPSNLTPDRYLLKAAIRDLQANRLAESTLQFEVAQEPADLPAR